MEPLEEEAGFSEEPRMEAEARGLGDSEDHQATRESNEPEEASASGSELPNQESPEEPLGSEEPGEGDDDQPEEDDDPEDEEEEGDSGEEEPASSTSIRQQFDQILAGKNVSIIGSQRKTINNYEGSAYRLVVSRLKPATVQQSRQIFVEPKNYAKELSRARESDERIILVYGLRDSGKLTCAINAACDLAATTSEVPRIVLYKRQPEEPRSLAEVVRSKKIVDGSFVILENAFAKNVSPRELQSPELEDLREALRERTLWLILTTELVARDLNTLAVSKVSTAGIDLRQVAQQNLSILQGAGGQGGGTDWYAKIAKNWTDLEGVLTAPLQVRQFCESLLELAPQTDHEILKIAQDSVNAGRRALRDWFSHLKSNEKLFAMLVHLSALPERAVADRLYRMALKLLRAQELIWYSDHRKLGLEDMLEAVQAQDLGGTVDFRDPTYEEEVRIQTGNWAHVLWTVLEALAAQVDPAAGWDGWQIRRALGTSLGRLSVHDPERFRKALDSLADHSDQRVSVVPGYALEAAVSRDLKSMGGFTLLKLGNWSVSGSPHRMWTAGAAIWRVFTATLAGTEAQREEAEALQKNLLTLLRTLAERSSRFSDEAAAMIKQDLAAGKLYRPERRGKRETSNELKTVLFELGRSIRKCVADGIVRIVLKTPEQSSILREWLKSADRNVLEVAKLAVRKTFASLKKTSYRPSEIRHSHFLDLLEPVLAAAGRGGGAYLDEMFLAFRSWLRWKKWQELIFRALLEVANGGSFRARETLRATLARLWSRDVAFEIAQAVIARSYAMDGILMDRPGFGRCALVLDSEFLLGNDQERERRENVFKQLRGTLASQIEGSLVYLGGQEVVSLPDAGAVLPSAGHPLPPLVIPAVESAGTEDLRLIVILTQRIPLDLEDLAACSWAQDVLMIVARSEAEPFDNGETIAIGQDPKPGDLAEVEERLRFRWARALAKAGPWDWLRVLEGFGFEAVLDQDPCDWLVDLVTRLGEPGEAQGHDDLARRILCVLCWHASLDLRECAILLREWLEEPAELSSPYLQRMGEAGGRALFRIHSAVPSSPEEEAPRILFEELADALAGQSEDGRETVLAAVHQWLEEPFWAEYLAGDVIEGRGRLLRWAEKFAPDQVVQLSRVLPKVSEFSPSIYEGWESLAAMIERFRVRAALGQPKVLPTLEEGETYAVLVLDGSDPDALRSQALDTLAVDLFKALASWDSMKAVIYRLGERRPVWVAGLPAPSTDALVAPKGPRQPRLLGPILANTVLSPERVSFILILSTGPVLDLEDWIDTEWRDRLVLHRTGSGLPRKPEVVALPVFPGNSRAASMVRFLMRANP